MYNLAAIDGDYIPYYAAGSSRVERRYYIVAEGADAPPLFECQYKREAVKWQKENAPEAEVQQTREVIDEREMYRLLDAEFEDIFRHTKAKEYELYLGAGRNFRYDILPTYKASREKYSRPVLLDAAKEYIKKRYNAEVVTDIEADDAVAIVCSNNPDAILVSPDKDLDQVPCMHYDPFHQQVYVVTEDVGLYSLYTQILMGDSTDDIPGIPRVGPATAAKILNGCVTAKDMWDACVRAHGSEESANLTASLVYVLRNHGEYWSPPT